MVSGTDDAVECSANCHRGQAQGTTLPAQLLPLCLSSLLYVIVSLWGPGQVQMDQPQNELGFVPQPACATAHAWKAKCRQTLPARTTRKRCTPLLNVVGHLSTMLDLLYQAFHCVAAQPTMPFCCIITLAKLKLLQESHQPNGSQCLGERLQSGTTNLLQCHSCCFHHSLTSLNHAKGFSTRMRNCAFIMRI